LPHFLFGTKIAVVQAAESWAKLLGFWFVASALESTLTDRLTRAIIYLTQRHVAEQDLPKESENGWR
jgi:hypothetical protein